MQDDVKSTVRKVLTKYLEENNCRKTPERYAVLDAVYSMDGYFTMDEISSKLIKLDFKVSRATLYNSMRLFVELRLVIRHRFQNGTKYEACCASQNHCHLLCTVCGKVTDVDMPDISEVMQNVKIRKFRKECYSMYIYGTCSACQYRINKIKSQKARQK